LTKSSKNDAGMFRNSLCYLLEGNMVASKHRSIFVDNVVKTKDGVKVSYKTSLEIWLIKQMVQWKIWTAGTVISALKIAREKNTRHHDEFGTAFARLSW